MKVVFWSPNHGQAGATTTAINHAVVASLLSGKRVLLGHGNFERSTLERCLLGSDERSEDIYSDQGLNALMKLAKNGRLAPSMIKDYTTPILNASRLDLMQGNDIVTYSQEDLDVLRKIFLYCGEIYDYSFIDLHSGVEDDFTVKMLTDADLIVVCLNQNLWINKDFFEGYEYKTILKDKNIIFHINNYNAKSKLNIKTFKAMFKVEEVIFTRHYDAIIENQNAGAMLDYILREYSSKKSELISDLSTNVNKIIFGK